MAHDPHSGTHTGQQQHMKSLSQASIVPPFNSNNNSRDTLPLIATTPPVTATTTATGDTMQHFNQKTSFPATTTTITPATPTTAAVEIKIIPKSVNYKIKNNNGEISIGMPENPKIQTKIKINNCDDCTNQQQSGLPAQHPNDTSINQQHLQRSPLQHQHQQQKFQSR